MLHIGVTLEIGRSLAEGLEVFYGEEASVSKSGVKTGSAVSLGENETVAVSLLGICGIDIHFFEVEISEHISDGKASARMTAVCRINCVDDPYADLTGNFSKFGFSLNVHCKTIPFYESCSTAKKRHNRTC
jgi:hypothetical protein